MQRKKSDSWARSLGRTLLGTLGAALMLAPAVAADLPGGKANWVVTIGSLGYDDVVTDNVVDTNEWVRLGYYTFDVSGKVSTSYWYWASKDKPPHVDTMMADCPINNEVPRNPDRDVPNCLIKTVEQFPDGVTGGYVGAYSRLPDGRLKITWTQKSDGTVLTKALNEYWLLETGLLSGAVARIKSPTFYQTSGSQAVPPARGQFTDYSANFGVGYGSKASLAYASRASMDELINDPHYNSQSYRGFNPTTAWTPDTPEKRLLNAQYSGGKWTYAGGGAGSDAGNKWTKCSVNQCIGWVQTNSSCKCASNDIKGRVIYIAEIGGGRRNTEWSWCRCLAPQGRCYELNSHIRPLLQVIDDSGTFRGWVGAEASTHVDLNGNPDDPEHAHYGVFDMVEVGTLFIDPTP